MSGPIQKTAVKTAWATAPMRARRQKEGAFFVGIAMSLYG